MKIAYYIKKKQLASDPVIFNLVELLRSSGCTVYDVFEGLQDSTDLVICFGGDGTILSASGFVAERNVPIMGVNMGRMGFLSDNSPRDVLSAIVNRTYRIQERTMLDVEVVNPQGVSRKFTALNDVSVRRNSPGMLGVDVSISGEQLPAYWADGVLLATSSGSTAYSLSVGGPICTPDAKVFVLAPIAPHNLNMRPLVISSASELEIVPRCNEKVSAVVSVDNHEYPVEPGTKVFAKASSISLKVANAGKSNFIQALRHKLFWGEDIRNQK